MATGPYLREVRKFLRSADWLTDEHAPMVVHLKTLAQVLDKQVEETSKVEERTAALFGTTWNRLKRPVEKHTAAKDDESEDGLTFS